MMMMMMMMFELQTVCDVSMRLTPFGVQIFSFFMLQTN